MEISLIKELGERYDLKTGFPMWLKPNLRFKRYLEPTDLPNRPVGHCRWCGERLKSAEFSWCSKGCFLEYGIRSSHRIMLNNVYKRDGGICCLCGIDTSEIYNIMLFIYKTPEEFVLQGKQGGWGIWHTSTPVARFWEADHIVPVSEGGGCCGLNNLRTLCIPCHKKETSTLSVRRNNKTVGRQMRICFND